MSDYCLFPGEDRCGTHRGHAKGCRDRQCKDGESLYRRELKAARDERSLSDRRTPYLVAGEWAESAACRGMDVTLFFPGRGQDFRTAKATCASCPVRIQCLNLALANDEQFGIWGGLAVEDREAIADRRRSA